MLTIPHDALRSAASSYASTFGHAVPDAVLAMFASRPGALVAEIQQAVRLTRPVPGWREHAQRVARAANGGVIR
jgi:hypothetical protein